MQGTGVRACGGVRRSAKRQRSCERHVETVDSSQLKVSALTPQELQCLRLVAEQRSSKEIAAELGISKASVDTYCNRARAKLGVSSRRAAARLVMEAEAATPSAATAAEASAPVAPPPPPSPTVTVFPPLSALGSLGAAGGDPDRRRGAGAGVQHAADRPAVPRPRPEHAARCDRSRPVITPLAAARASWCAGRRWRAPAGRRRPRPSAPSRTPNRYRCDHLRQVGAQADQANRRGRQRPVAGRSQGDQGHEDGCGDVHRERLGRRLVVEERVKLAPGEIGEQQHRHQSNGRLAPHQGQDADRHPEADRDPEPQAERHASSLTRRWPLGQGSEQPARAMGRSCASSLHRRSASRISVACD